MWLFYAKNLSRWRAGIHSSAMNDSEKIVLVQGANRGIGLEFVRQLLGRKDVGMVIASCRHPGDAELLNGLGSAARLRVIPLDVEDEATVRAAAGEAARHVKAIDLLINCAGILHDKNGLAPERRLAEIEPGFLHKSFAVNAVGPALVIKHFCGLLQKAHQPVVANISARVGSISDNRLGGWYAYRMSKAAQNMLTRTLSVELGRGSRKVTVVALHPGTVDTDLSRPFQGNVPAGKLFSPARAVRQLLGIIDGLAPEDTGKFFAWDGSEITW